jgi:SAM-dependent methyltransferase
VSSNAAFVDIQACWICGSRQLMPIHELMFELSEYRVQDPDLAAYSGAEASLLRCTTCGFAQPAKMPALPRYFDRLYDQRWSDEWIRGEFASVDKDLIFDTILARLGSRLPAERRRLLDVGAHAGRFIARARRAGWAAEGLELNPRTAAFAAQHSGGRIRRLNVHDLDLEDAGYDAVTITDVLEHIPEPVPVLKKIHDLLAPGGIVAVKVPSGPAQLVKETWRGRLRLGYRPTLADNLVHVSHFSPASLRVALERGGFTAIDVVPAAPELHAAGGASRALRRALYAIARSIPGGVHLPIALNLQAYACRPATGD